MVTSWHKEWIFGVAMCKIYMTTTSINQFTSSIFLTVMSADRYVAVCHPISSPKFRTNVIARVVSLTAWATSALLMVPVFMYAATIKKMDGMSNTNLYLMSGNSRPSGKPAEGSNQVSTLLRLGRDAASGTVGEEPQALRGSVGLGLLVNSEADLHQPRDNILLDLIDLLRIRPGNVQVIAVGEGHGLSVGQERTSTTI